MLLKLIIALIIFFPILILTGIIWLFGGWTIGWYQMPNPLDRLLDWALEF